MLSARDVLAPASSPPSGVFDGRLVAPAPPAPPPAAGSAPAGQPAGRRRARAERMRQRIRSALAGVALALLTGAGAALADGNVYTVQAGDSLKDVASRFGVTTGQLVAVNGLGDPDALQIGQTLRLPDGAAADRAQPAARGNRVEPEPVDRSVRWPLEGPITTYFGEPGPLWRLGFHPGLDIGASVGTPIRAVGSGVVIEADDEGYNKGYGHYVKIDHGGGLHSLYGHMSVVSAREGDRVVAGTVIGQVGMTGFTTGPHLHLEIRQDGTARDPLRYLD